jgi:hypothetical protein
MRKLERTIAKAFLICFLAAGLLLNSGCLPFVIMDSVERKNFGEQNIEREKAGLRPLTWEEYHYHGMHLL